MKIEIKELKERKCVIRFEDVEPYFVNSLRRIMLSELPKLAIENVIVYDNTSALFDEIIAHRLGMIPLPTDLNLLTFRENCVCKGKGCPNCTVRYTLSKEGECTVYSGDLQPEDNRWAVKEDKIPIVKLYGDQRLILEVEAILGRGKDHAKWQAVQAPCYKMDIIIEYDKKREKEVKEFIDGLPKGIVDMKNGKIVLKDESRLAELEYYISKEKIDYITIKRDQNNLTFSFETDGSLSAKDALLESAKILENKYSEFYKLVKNLK